MRRAMCQLQDLPFNIFATQLRELNNYLPLFPKSIASKKMAPEELNEIILHVVPNGLAKQANI